MNGKTLNPQIRKENFSIATSKVAIDIAKFKMPIISLNQRSKRVEVSSFELDNQVVFTFFDKLASTERDDALLRALYIGVLALMEDRVSAFLSKTANHLGTELESLKMIFDMKQELFFKSSVKGMIAEESIVEFLNQFFIDQRLNDKAALTGNTVGLIKRNKTGDIICHVNGDDSVKIALECKFDKNIRMGDISTKDITTRKVDTAWSQLLEAQANRDAKVSIIVFDVSSVDSTILNSVQNLRYIPAVGMVVIIDSQRGDYSNLAIAYMLARDIAVNAHEIELDKDVLGILINRIVKDISEIISIKSLVQSNIENNKRILLQLEKSILMMEFNQKYLVKFLSDGQLTKLDLLNFYIADDVKDRFKLIEKEIKEMII